VWRLDIDVIPLLRFVIPLEVVRMLVPHTCACLPHTCTCSSAHLCLSSAHLCLFFRTPVLVPHIHVYTHHECKAKLRPVTTQCCELLLVIRGEVVNTPTYACCRFIWLARTSENG